MRLISVRELQAPKLDFRAMLPSVEQPHAGIHAFQQQLSQESVQMGYARRYVYYKTAVAMVAQLTCAMACQEPACDGKLREMVCQHADMFFAIMKGLLKTEMRLVLPAAQRSHICIEPSFDIAFSTPSFPRRTSSLLHLLRLDIDCKLCIPQFASIFLSRERWSCLDGLRRILAWFVLSCRGTSSRLIHPSSVQSSVRSSN